MIHRNLAIALVSAGGYIAGVAAIKAAERAGLLAAGLDGRAVEVFSGLALAVYANLLPKHVGTFRGPMAAMRMQSVLRVSGWAFTLGGLGFAVTSLLPLPEAVPLALLGAATAYVVGYSAWAFMECSSRQDRPTA